MEVYFKNVALSVDESEFTIAVATVLHGPEFQCYSSGLPLNFNVQLFSRRHSKRTTRQNEGTRSGTITLPTEQVGQHFLRLYGARGFTKKLTLRRRDIYFDRSKQPLRKDIVDFIRDHPWQHPQVLQERERRANQLDGHAITIKTLQFGWGCRDGTFSVEWQKDINGSLSFDDSRRGIRIEWMEAARATAVVIRYAYIDAITVPQRATSSYSISLELRVAPSFEAAPGLGSDRRTRSSQLDIDFGFSGPYISRFIRLICHGHHDITEFKSLGQVAGLTKPEAADYDVKQLRLFSPEVLQEFSSWLSKLPWPIAFQCEALLCGGAIDTRELLDLRKDIERLVRTSGTESTISTLTYFGSSLKAMPWYNAHQSGEVQTVRKCFVQAQERAATSKPSQATDAALRVLKITMGPTSMKLSGPEPEESNRVLRRYVANLDSFIRVQFTDEDGFPYRFDREIDTPGFVKERVGSALRDGIRLGGGRHFQFLAYSQSALKEHTVWFVKQFKDSQGRVHDAQSIRNSLGTFDKEKFCAARLGARMAQAFSATIPSVEVEEIFEDDDIPAGSGGPACLTDGIGRMSRAFAEEVWDVIQDRSNRRKKKKRADAPSAYQIRYQGAKGMLSVDYALKGRVVALRPSMIKFEDANSRDMEIARAFDKPTKMYLNRPLIMILEGLGVPKDVFMGLLDRTLKDIHESADSFRKSSKLLETHGLGGAFHLPSLFLSLKKLSDKHPRVAMSIKKDAFYRRVIEFGIHHIKRELKYRARIPVPDSWTLVGVVDVHGYLNEMQVFACVRPKGSEAAIYLEGPMLITRSPVIAAGDVQLVHAIGRPPRDSPFAREELPNCVVFPSKGSHLTFRRKLHLIEYSWIAGPRSIPSMLGGGDVDGDLYNISPLRDLHPRKIARPAEYLPGKRKILDRPCTIDDISDFVVEYINSDLLGVISINFLLIADSTEENIFHPDCIKLAQLHSDAVDYPKTGMPVPHKEIPQPPTNVKPDWNANELNEMNRDHYQSRRALGHLFRRIDLPALSIADEERRALRKQVTSRKTFTLDEAMTTLRERGGRVATHPVAAAVANEVRERLRFTSSRRIVEELLLLFEKYSTELLYICQANTLSYTRGSQLTEEEAVVCNLPSGDCLNKRFQIGTIVQKSSHPRRRREAMAQVREQTSKLVHEVREEISGDDSRELDEWLRRAWTAWEISLIEEGFGAKSFGWIALQSLFDVLKEIDQAGL